MKIHVLPGDSLIKTFEKTNIEGEIIVCRECLIEGEVKTENLAEFWNIRAEFIAKNYGESKDGYFQNVAGEFEKLKNLAASSAEINLWFEYELFCSVNLWFCLYLLREKEAKFFRVAPFVRDKNEIWKGFSNLSAEDLEKCFAARTPFTETDILLGANLWNAFQKADYETLEKLSETKSLCFPHLKEVCRAEIEKQTRPPEILSEIIAAGKTEFADIFTEFSNLAGVYGYGDSQVKNILSEINPKP